MAIILSGDSFKLPALISLNVAVANENGYGKHAKGSQVTITAPGTVTFRSMDEAAGRVLLTFVSDEGENAGVELEFWFPGGFYESIRTYATFHR